MTIGVVKPDNFVPLVTSSISIAGEGVGVGVVTHELCALRTSCGRRFKLDATEQGPGDGVALGEADGEGLTHSVGSSSHAMTVILVCLPCEAAADAESPLGTTFAAWPPQAVNAATTRTASALKRTQPEETILKPPIPASKAWRPHAIRYSSQASIQSPEPK